MHDDTRPDGEDGDDESGDDIEDAYADFRGRHGPWGGSAGDDEHDDADPEQRRAAAYDAFKKRLGTPKARRYPKPTDPSWLRPQPKGKPRKSGPWGGAAGDADPNEAARNAYAGDLENWAINATRRVRRKLMDAWAS